MNSHKSILILFSLLFALACSSDHVDEVERHNRTTEITSSDTSELPIELICDNYDTLARRTFITERMGVPTCQELITCDGFDHKIRIDYISGEADVIEFYSPAYTVVLCYYYQIDGLFELGGKDYISTEKTSLVIPHYPTEEDYQVRVSFIVGDILYPKEASH